LKAIVQDRYGRPDEVLKLEEIDRPVPGEREILVRVRAAGVNPLDWHYVQGSPAIARISMGRGRPKDRVRGVDVSGQVEAVGSGVKKIRQGDEVFGWCDGAFAEFASGVEDHFVPKLANTSYEQAAAVPVAAITALQGLRNVGKLQSGQRVLVNGASGGVGTYAVQIAKALGAEVTGVCSARNVELVRSLGADRVIDYGQEDFTKRAERYDLILDNAGSHTIGSLRRALKPGGTLVYNSGASMSRMAGAILLSRLGQKVFTFLAKLNHDDLALIAGLMEQGKVKSVIDRSYPLDQTAAAIAYVEAGHARGKVVVTMSS
jgi:NADPH:quinone reductase-like Zn-dependent oxidoreductase